VANQQLEKENLKLRQEMQFLKEEGTQLIYKSRAMADLLGMLDRVVRTDSTVLIQGETGTGKELLARYIQEHSKRADQAFVPVNCGAIPSDLVESAFFGHRKGSFTGATDDQKGYFEMAHQGTLFLDEVGEAPLELQVKLLRVLQDGQILPVGGQAPKRIDVRVIASTNRRLGQMVEEGSFRQDLFFRLNVFSVLIPPLRARMDDVEALALYFLERFEKRLNKPVPGFEPNTLQLLQDYAWPGNVRELENEIERIVILCDPGLPIPPKTLSERIRNYRPAGKDQGLLKDQLADLERRLILDALDRHHQNKSHAAESLGITRQTIIAKLKTYRSG
jgi:Nif-specific regulatory protein